MNSSLIATVFTIDISNSRLLVRFLSGSARNIGAEGESRRAMGRETREKRSGEKIELFTQGKNTKVRKIPLCTLSCV